MAAPRDERPPLWTGHVFVAAADVRASARFYEQLGMRAVFADDRSAALELRGGTHLLIQHDPEPEPEADAPTWDLMVDDLEAMHAQWRARGLPVGDIVDEAPIPHRRFDVTDPDGHRIGVRDSHVVGPA